MHLQRFDDSPKTPKPLVSPKVSEQGTPASARCMRAGEGGAKEEWFLLDVRFPLTSDLRPFMALFGKAPFQDDPKRKGRRLN